MKKLFPWILVTPLIIVVLLGWLFPLLGFMMPIVVVIALSTGIFKGRYFCGHYCPRGQFYDRILSRISPQKKFPLWVKQKWFRLSLIVLMVIVFLSVVLQNPSSVYQWGLGFWVVCTMTTVIGIVLGMIYHQRTWCTFCPVGQANAVLGKKCQRCARKIK